MVPDRLPAVEPDGLCVVDSDSEGSIGRRVFSWNEAGEEPARRERMARVAKT